jgi:hypothetical protein
MKQTNEKTMTNNKQQTAVEWLAEQMEILHYDYWAEHISKDEKNQRLKQLKEQAKEMEKERIIAAHYEGQCDETEGYPLEISEQYYKQTYGGGEQ